MDCIIAFYPRCNERPETCQLLRKIVLQQPTNSFLKSSCDKECKELGCSESSWMESSSPISFARINSVLPPLELEVLDGEEEEEGEERDDGDVQAGDEVEVAVLESEVALQELLHRLLWLPWHLDQLRPVSQLREHEPVHRPCRRVCPIHPSPPHRDHLSSNDESREDIPKDEDEEGQPSCYLNVRC